MINAILVAVGGFFGALARFSISHYFKRKKSSSFPIATLFVNLLGSFLLGYIAGTGQKGHLPLLFGTGFMGAFTTFSTFNLENSQFIVNKKWNRLFIYLGISYTFGIILAFLGMELGNIMS
jgi:fluoride exporter